MAFVSCFSTEGLVEIGERSLSLPHLSLPELASKLDVQLLSLARASILDPRLRAIPRDEIAAAMLLVSRDLCTVRPLWTKRLTEMTGFEANQLAEVSAILLESIPARNDTASDLHTDRRSHGEGEDELLAIATGSLSLREAAQSPLLINKTSGGFDKASHASPTSVADMR